MKINHKTKVYMELNEREAKELAKDLDKAKSLNKTSGDLLYYLEEKVFTNNYRGYGK